MEYKGTGLTWPFKELAGFTLESDVPRKASFPVVGDSSVGWDKKLRLEKGMCATTKLNPQSKINQNIR